MIMGAGKEKSCTANRSVTVRLHGWSRQVRRLSLVKSCWVVTFEFEIPAKKDSPVATMIHDVFQSEDYAKALEKYNFFKKIVS